jgi:hypothetical protein
MVGTKKRNFFDDAIVNKFTETDYPRTQKNSRKTSCEFSESS